MARHRLKGVVQHRVQMMSDMTVTVIGLSRASLNDDANSVERKLYIAVKNVTLVYTPSVSSHIM